jgi:hypothetical protein
MVTRQEADKAALVQRLSRKDRPAEVEYRVHDAVDIASGRIHTTPMKGSPSAKTRVQRLMSVGFSADASIFTGRRYRLTPQRPYQVTPLAWLDAFFDPREPIDDTFIVYSTGAGVDYIWWRVPPSFPQFWATCNFSFTGLRAGRGVMTLSFEVWPYQGTTGKVVIFIGAQTTEIQITEPAARTVDIGFVHDGGPVLQTMVLLRQGIFDFVFHSVSLRHSHP